MARLCLEAGRLHAEIEPAFGACLTDLSIDGPEGDRYPILRRAASVLDSPGRAAMFLLAPWTNRVAGAAFTFRGAEHRLRANFPDGSAIHGDVCTRAWRIADRSPVSARLVFDSREHEGVNFPWAFGCVARYEIGPERLGIELSVTNLDETAMPCGCGVHPYFVRRVWSDRDEVRVRAGVGGRYPHRGQIPTGQAAPDAASRRLGEEAALGDPGLDDCFGGFTGRAEVAWPASRVRVTMDCSEALSHLVVFTPRAGGPGGSGEADAEGPLAWFCLEPVSMANDGFNLGERGIEAGVRVLDPGQTLNTRVTVHVHAEG